MANFVKKIIIGTAQFGLDYGISNQDGITPELEQKNLLDYASSIGITKIDTAQGYGHAEESLGRYPSLNQFQVITKISPFRSGQIKNQINESLEKLNRDHIEGILFHNSKEVSEEVIDELNLIKADGLVKKIGVSIYDEGEFDKIKEVFTPDIIQLPLNIFDREKLESGFLDRLKKEQVEIHTRSLFLQGLLFIEPDKLDPYFSPIVDHLKSFHQNCADLGITPITAALSFMSEIEQIDHFVMGFVAREQLAEIVAEEQKIISLPNHFFKNWEILEKTYLNPVNWPKK